LYYDFGQNYEEILSQVLIS